MTSLFDWREAFAASALAGFCSLHRDHALSRFVAALSRETPAGRLPGPGWTKAAEAAANAARDTAQLSPCARASSGTDRARVKRAPP
jgi:hypothetical protein